MKIIKWIWFCIIIWALILASPACHDWQGRFQVTRVQASTRYFPGTDQSAFGILIEMANAETQGVGASFWKWTFEICENDDVLLEITESNYNTFNFWITLFQDTPVSDSSGDFRGTLNVVSGRAVEDWKVPGNIFQGRVPSKLKYRVILVDKNGYDQDFSGEIQLQHTVL